MTVKNNELRGGIRILGFAALLIICLVAVTGCTFDLTSQGNTNTSQNKNTENSCRQMGLLTCITTSASSGSFCCQSMFTADASVGYLCVLGLDSFAGCYDSIEQARQMGCNGTIVRCTR